MNPLVSQKSLGKCKWDTDRALRSTYSGRVGTYQIRSFVIICIVFGVAESWLSGFVYFNGLPPTSLQCFNKTDKLTFEDIQNIRAINSDTDNKLGENNSYDIDFIGDLNSSIEDSDWSQQGVLTSIQVFRDFNVSDKEPKNIHIQFGLLCGEEYKIQFSRIGYILSKHVGAFLCGYLADQVGRKVTFIGASIICYVMLLFQILSEDFVSYCFFMIFIGLSAGGIVTIGVTTIMETFPICSRTIFAVILLIVPFLFDLVIPWLAMCIRWWKMLQAVCGLLLLLAGILYWWSEETVYYYISLKDYCQAIESLTRIAKYNNIAFQSKFKEAKQFLESKKNKSVQCDFQPLLRVQDIPKLKEKYPAFNFADVMEQSSQKQESFIKRLIRNLKGHNFHSNTSRFKLTDYFQSGVLTSYIFLICALWFVNGVTYSSLESHELSWRLKNNPFTGYCYRSLTAIAGCLITFPVLYKLGRRWPTFCLYLVGEVCLLASIVAKIEREFTSITLFLIYLIGKASTYGAYIVLTIFTVEIFPTGLRCTSLGIGFLFRGIGIIIADPELLNFHDWTSRLIYGFLSLLIGSLALFLPEMKRYPLSRTFGQVETIPSGISKRIRNLRNSMRNRRRKKQQQMLNKEQARQGHVRFVTSNGMEYDPQSTLHTMYEAPRSSVLCDTNRMEFEPIKEESIIMQDSEENNQHMYDIDYKTQNEDAYFSENL